VYAFLIIGNIEYRTHAAIVGGSPRPSKGNKKINKASSGIVSMTFSILNQIFAILGLL